MSKILAFARSNAIALLALFVALGGTSYAAFSLPRNSVGSRQLRNGAVTNKKLGRGAVAPANLSHKSIAGYMRAYVQLNSQGQIVASRPAAQVAVWRTGSQPGWLITWSQPMASSCFALATTLPPDMSYANAALSSGGKSNAQTYVGLSAPEPVSVAVMCPQP